LETELLGTFRRALLYALNTSSELDNGGVALREAEHSQTYKSLDLSSVMRIVSCTVDSV
jgi:hypothetical protein